MFTWHSITLHLRTPFGVAYGVSETRQVFWLRLAADAGWGESAIPPYYGVADADQIAFWQTIGRRDVPFPDDPAEIPFWLGEEGPAPARAALDLALHDRIARRRGLPLYQLLGLPRPPTLTTSYTISLAAPAKMAQQAKEAQKYPILKIKLGADDDEACVAAVRAARPDARLRIDANAAWSPDEAVRRVAALERYDLELIEQPVGKHDIDGMGFVQARTRLPVVADESLQTLADVKRLADVGVRGINLKLMKVGGLAPALAVLRRARELGLQVLLGCMVETSLGVTAALHLADFADWLDLDGPLLIGNDPFLGAAYDAAGAMTLPDRPGIGVSERSAIANAPTPGNPFH